MKGKKFMDALDVLSGEDSDSDSGVARSGGEGTEGGAEETTGPSAKRAKGAIDLETLQRCGYKSGPSVLLMPEPKMAAAANWGWDNGESHKNDEPEQETAQERQATREAVTTGVDASMGVARRAAGLKEAQHQARREEREANREKLFGKGQKGKGKDSWNAKEKRKREEGKATKGKNFVEEEKRLGRSLGMYSGFD